jgi:hypothetical protein
MNIESKSFVPFNVAPKERCYLLPEGAFQGMLTKAIWGPNKFGKLNAELSFEVTGLCKPGVQYMARAVYLESELDRLKEHLASWQGYAFLERAIKAGGVDLQTLEGKFATIQVVHGDKRAGYQDVLRRVVGLYPPEVLASKPSGLN